MATFIQLGDSGREKTPPHLREDLRRRPQRAVAATEFRATLAELGIAQCRVARLFSVSPRHIRRWRSGDRRVPPTVGVVLRLLAMKAVTIDQVEEAAASTPARSNGGAEGEPLASLEETSRERSLRLAVKTPEPPAPLKEALEQAKATTLAEKICALTPEACRWPCGDPRHPDFHFCGNPVAEKPYCARHRALAFMALPTGGSHGARIVAQWGRQWPKASRPKGTHHAVPVALSVPPAEASNRGAVR